MNDYTFNNYKKVSTLFEKLKNILKSEESETKNTPASAPQGSGDKLKIG